MRIVTWNCCRGRPEEKLALLDAFNYDIAVLQECGEIPNIPGQQFWVGDSPQQGVAIIARGDYTITPEPGHPEVLPYFIPLRVAGPQNFVMFAVWSKNHRRAQYVRSVVRAIRLYREVLEKEPCVIVGDLNTNAFWNNSHPKHENHAAMVTLLDELEMTSSYHAFRNEEHGQETLPTFFLTWNQKKPYHLDFCIVPNAWLNQITEVTIPPFDSPWSRSDHRPLLVEFGKIV